MAELKIIRASAGSGKTFQLTQEILKILLTKQDNYYRTILAVTFTNKATAEMKGRILEELHLLSANEKSTHIDSLMHFLKMEEGSIRAKASSVLSAILHGYSWFRVETIDTFFQAIIRSFLRELNISGHYNIELDQDKILAEAIDRLLNKTGENNQMLEWLLEHISNKIDEAKSWSIDTELNNLGKTLFKENIAEQLPNLKKVTDENTFMKDYRKELLSITRNFEIKIAESANEALAKMKERGFDISDFFYTNRGPAGYLTKRANGDFSPKNSYVSKVLDEPEKYPGGKCKRKDEAEQFGINIITPAILEIENIIEADISNYNSAKAILKNLHILGILSNLNDEITEIRKEKGIFLISDASPFIQRIINNNDTPFIYEKTGNHFNHLMIDEFQDTSGMQWSNFKPLIENSLGKGQDCLVVGDVKQSIYRWRNSDWEILENKIKENLHEETINEIYLNTNWRSDANVIRFNNEFFKTAAGYIEVNLSPAPETISPPTQIYSDVAQNVPPHKPGDDGLVNIKIFSKDDTKDNDEFYGENLTNNINDSLKQGYSPGDIALLVRYKKDGIALANYVVDANKNKKFIKEVGIISNESLFLHSSPSVQLLISGMRYINEPANNLLAAELLANFLHVTSTDADPQITFPEGEFDVKQLNEYITPDFIEACKLLKQESLFLMTEKLADTFNLYASNNELVYIHSFLDLVFTYTSTELSNLDKFLDYWDDEGDKKTISAAETSSAIRILTIHKSKGLQFPIVIIPFSNKKNAKRGGDKIWTSTEVLPYGKLPYFPVDLSKELEQSIFSTEYQKEHYLSVIDDLNLLYVAFTRAEKALFAGCVNDNDIAKYIIHSLESLVKQNSFNTPIAFNEEENRFVLGKLSRKEKGSNPEQYKMMPIYAPNLSLPEVKVSNKASQFFSTTNLLDDHATYGNVLHAIMEDVVVSEDLPNAVKSKTEEGIITENEAESILNLLKNALSNDKAKLWFDPGSKVLNEADIILPGAKSKRPDRVVFSGNKTIVIDYKFGQEDDKDKHIRQVQEYMDLLCKMGHTHIEGYVWYITENDIITAPAQEGQISFKF
jgi:ATP-dependent exoDNAse (exonuclease V) beta subunit